jgi:cytochrome c oxidase subunit II
MLDILGQTSTNIFRLDSTPAQVISDYTVSVLAICAVIFAVVAGLLLYTTIRYRRCRADDGLEPPQIYGSNQLELA